MREAYQEDISRSKGPVMRRVYDTGLGLEECLCGDFIALDWRIPGLGVGGLGAEFGGDDARDASGGDGGVEDVGLRFGGRVR